MTTLHVGMSRTEAFSASDGSTPSAVVGVSETPELVTVSGSTITGVAAGQTNVHWSCPGYLNAVQTVQVLPKPQLIVTDGPES